MQRDERRILMVDEETETKIAKIVGFKDVETYRKAEEVCFNGILELIKAMDHDQISIEKAAEIAKLPKKEQLYAIKSLHLKEV
jgi:hypothetical protein